MTPRMSITSLITAAPIVGTVFTLTPIKVARPVTTQTASGRTIWSKTAACTAILPIIQPGVGPALGQSPIPTPAAWPVGRFPEALLARRPIPTPRIWYSRLSHRSRQQAYTPTPIVVEAQPLPRRTHPLAPLLLARIRRLVPPIRRLAHPLLRREAPQRSTTARQRPSSPILSVASIIPTQLAIVVSIARPHSKVIAPVKISA